MACYRKKTSISSKVEAPDAKVEAVLWDGTDESLQQVKKMTGGDFEVTKQDYVLLVRLHQYFVSYSVTLGYWAVKHRPDLISGCRPDIFQSTYQLIEE